MNDPITSSHPLNGRLDVEGGQVIADINVTELASDITSSSWEEVPEFQTWAKLTLDDWGQESSLIGLDFLNGGDAIANPDLDDLSFENLAVAVSEVKLKTRQFFEQSGAIAESREIFGDAWTEDKFQAVIEDLLTGQDLPDISIVNTVSAGTTPLGFFSPAIGIALDKNLLSDTERLKLVVAEELGHYIDERLNLTDARGDEGALFANRIFGLPLIPSEQDQNDSAFIKLDGQLYLVEQAFDANDLLFERVKYIDPEFTKGKHGWTANNDYPRHLVDLDGDGKEDIVGFHEDAVVTALSKGDGTFESAIINPDLGFVKATGWTSFEEYPRLVGDMDGDGYGDIIGFHTSDIYIAFGTGDGTFQKAIATSAPSVGFTVNAGGWTSFNDYPRHIIDVNGDGMDDIIGFGSSNIFVSISNGDGTFQDAVKDTGFTKATGWTTFDDYPRLVGDVDGDGKADVVGFHTEDIYVAFGNGDGTFQEAIATESLETGFTKNRGAWTTFNEYPRYLEDINGDGKDDILGLGVTNIFVAFSNGDGTFQEVITSDGDFAHNIWGSLQDYYRVVGDLDGDGQSDILGFGQNYLATALAKEQSELSINIQSIGTEGGDVYRNIRLYDASQGLSNIDILDASQTIRMSGNGWHKVNLPTIVSPHTVIELDFKVSIVGEIQGIGFASENNEKTVFKLSGTQDWGINDFIVSDGETDWQKIIIPVGEYFTGEFESLLFVNDHDDGLKDAEALFRNIKIYESTDWKLQYINRDSTTYAENDFDINQVTLGSDLTFATTTEEHVRQDGNTLAWISKDFQDGEIVSGRQDDYFQVLATTSVYLDADRTYQITSQSDDGTRFLLRQRGTDEINEIAGNDWRTRSIYEPETVVNFDVQESGYYDFLVKYFENTGGALVNVKLEELDEVKITQVRLDGTEIISEEPLVGYDPGQGYSDVDILDSAQTIRMRGNGWHQVDLPTIVSPHTMLEFDFKAPITGEIQGLGFVSDSSSASDDNGKTVFKLSGTQDWGIDDFIVADGETNWQKIIIPVGEYFTGEFDSLLFLNDHDGGSQDAESYFRNIKIYESTDWKLQFINRDGQTYKENNFKINPATLGSDLAFVTIAESHVRQDENTLAWIAKDFQFGEPLLGGQDDHYQVLATTSVYLDAERAYQIATQSDDGTQFLLRKRGTTDWIFIEGNDWRNRSIFSPAKDIFFDVEESGYYDFLVKYYENTGGALVNVRLDEVPLGVWTAEYFDNKNFFNAPVHSERLIQTAEQGIFFGDDGYEPAQPPEVLPEDNFSARWKTSVQLEAGFYHFRNRADDGARVFIDDVEIIEDLDSYSGFAKENNGYVYIPEGIHTIKVLYVEEYFSAGNIFEWNKVVDPDVLAAINVIDSAGIITVGSNGNDIDNNFVDSYQERGAYESLGLPKEEIVDRGHFLTQEFLSVPDAAISGVLMKREGKSDVYWVDEEFFEIYQRESGYYGDFGAAISDRYEIEGGTRQDFEGAAIFQYGDDIYVLSGPIWLKYRDFQEQDGFLGAIQSDVYEDDQGYQRQDFEGGYILLNPETGIAIPYDTSILDSLPVDGGNGTTGDWRVEYWGNKNLGGEPGWIEKVDSSEIILSAGMGAPLGTRDIPEDNFSVRWTTTSYFDGGIYNFFNWADDGVKVYVDGVEILNEWIGDNDLFDRRNTAHHLIEQGYHTVTVEYFDELENASNNLKWSVAAPDEELWVGEFFDSANLQGNPLQQAWQTPSWGSNNYLADVIHEGDFLAQNWGSGGAEFLATGNDNFSSRWLKLAHFEEAGIYQFNSVSDDGVRVWVDDELIIDKWDMTSDSKRMSEK